MKGWLCVIAPIAAALLCAHHAIAAALPGPADAGRVEQRQEQPQMAPDLLPSSLPMQVMPNIEAPPQSKSVKIIIQAVHVTGMTVYGTADIKDIYAPYIGHEVTLDTVWLIAAKITEHYRNDGYFLSRAIVPQQEIKDGAIILRVVEGYIGNIKLNSPLAHERVVKQWLDRLQSYHPVKANQIETILLHLNDLPGVSLHAVLEPMDTTATTEGSVRLVLEPQSVPRLSASLSFDNNGSRFLGPYEAQAQVQAIILPTQRTTFSWLSSVPWHELKYGSLRHEVPLFTGATLELYGSYTKAIPGYTLKPEDIKSRSTLFGTAMNYSIIREREENLSTRLAFEGQNTHADILGTPLTRDSIRVLRLGVTYQRTDDWAGQNALSGTLSHGLNFLGASQGGQLDLSRAEATPNFTKFNLDASRLQDITENWGILAALSSQMASGPLYSSEQFGYGGQAFGRAYDNSEITGDQGIDGSGELRYSGFGPWYHLQPVPYEFYDIGAVWDKGTDQTMPYASGSSAGAGFRLLSDFGLSANMGLAFPLTRRVATPIYGNGKSPRYFVQLGYNF